MSRGARGFLLAMGGLILFGGLAVAGFAVGNMLDEDGDDATTLVGFPWVRPADGEVEVPAWVAEEQDRTARAVDRSGPPGTETDPIDGIGDPEAGGQMLLVVDTPPDSDVSTGESTSTTGQPGSDAGRSSPAAPLPSEVFYDIPELIGLVDLSDVEIADPVGSVDVDLCAGPERLPETPAGCPAGFGGTIVPFDGGIGGGADTGDQSGRPPTGLTGSGTDVLSVRTFRRSAQPEEVGVSVVEWDGSWAGPENGCDPAAVTAEGRALPEMQRFAVTTIPIEGTSDPELWPWDPAYDTLEVFRFGLEPGTAYAVCVYWLDISGTDPRVASWEATQVVTASGRRFTLELISWDTYSLDNAHPITEEVEEFAVRGDCSGGTRARFNWPGEGTRSVLDPPWRLCDVSHLSGVLQQGGLQVDVELTLTIRGTLVTRIFNGWLPISRSDIFCRVDCRDSVAVGLPMPDVRHEPYETDDWRAAIPPDTWRAGRVNLVIRFDAPLEARNGWIFGDMVGYEAPDPGPPPPVVTRFLEVTRISEPLYGVGDNSYGTTRTFSLFNDVPLDVSARVLDFDGGIPCSLPGTPLPTYESTAPSTEHRIILDNLCLGETYWLEVTAIDSAGTRYNLAERRTRADQWLFNTAKRLPPSESVPGYALDLQAELVLGSHGGDECFYLGDLTFLDSWWGGVAEPVDNSRLDPTSLAVWDTAAWLQSATMPRYVAATGTADTLSPPIGFTIRAAEARERRNPISIRVRHVPWAATSCLRTSWTGAEELVFSADPTLTELLGGIVIRDTADPDSYLAVRVTHVYVNSGS